MLRPLKCTFSYLISFVVFELISGQLDELILSENQTFLNNSTSSQLFEKFNNTSVILDIKQIVLENNTNTTANICDDIDCIHNFEICKLNQCLGLKYMNKIHYVVTCVIVTAIIILMLATMYACHRESKRSVRWHNADNRCEQQLMAFRIMHSFSHNRNVRPIYEVVPMQSSSSPPSYEAPPPSYEVAMALNSTQTTK